MATTDKSSISTLVHATVKSLGDGDKTTGGNDVSSTENKDVCEGAPCELEANSRRHSENARKDVRSNTSTGTRTVDESAVERFVCFVCLTTLLAILGGLVINSHLVVHNSIKFHKLFSRNHRHLWVALVFRKMLMPLLMAASNYKAQLWWHRS